MQAQDIFFLVIGVVGALGTIYAVVCSRFSITKSLAIGEIDYRHETETFTLIYEVGHLPIKSIPLYRLFHWFLPVTISVGGPGSRTWGLVRIHCLDATQSSIKEVDNFIDHHDTSGRTIKLPRAFKFDPHVQYISVEMTRHFPRQLVNRESIVLNRRQISTAPVKRWRYDLHNISSRDIRDFEIEMDELPQSFTAFTIAHISPSIDTTESDVVVHDETRASEVNITRMSRKVIWHVPVLKGQVAGSLEFEFS